MLLSLRKNGLTSLFKEVRVLKGNRLLGHFLIINKEAWMRRLDIRGPRTPKLKRRMSCLGHMHACQSPWCHPHSAKVKVASPQPTRKAPHTHNDRTAAQTTASKRRVLIVGTTLIFHSLVFWFSLVFATQGNSLVFRVFSAAFPLFF